MKSAISRIYIVIVIAVLLGLVFAYFKCFHCEYEVASDEAIGEYTDSASEAIFDRAFVKRISRTDSLDNAFDAVIDAISSSIKEDDFISRDAIRRRSDYATIRFGQTRTCYHALFYDDGSMICDAALYLGLVEATKAVSNEFSLQ